MGQIIANGGIMMWPILACAALVVGLSVSAGLKLFRNRAPGSDARSSVDAILFWGAFAFVLGVLGTTIGIVYMARAIELAGDVSTGVVWSGVSIVLITTLAGLSVLTLALLVWFTLRMRVRSLTARV